MESKSPHLFSMEDLKEFFSVRISEAIKNSGLKVQRPISLYLHNLLFSIAVKPIDLDLMLFELYKNSVEAKLFSEQFTFSKMLGDHSLLLSGYFKKGDKRYSSKMGKIGYVRSYSLTGNNIFQKLCDEFDIASAVLGEVKHLNSAMSMNDLLKLYALWTETGDPGLKGVLMRNGFLADGVLS